MRPKAPVAVYAGSYDPFTYGHKAVAEDTLKIFEKIVIAIGVNGSKTPLFKTARKIEIIKGYWPDETFGVDDRIQITTFSGLLTQFCSEWTENAVLIRGLRAVSDFESEMVIAAANRRLSEQVSTVFIPTQPEVAYISSSVVKEIARNTTRIEDLLPYVTEEVAEEMMASIGRTQRAPWMPGS
jgi:pantetheine-phosphate adenylyltransferase